MTNQTKPSTWKSGSDPDRHSRYTPWLRARAQAVYRKEPWTMTFDDWCAVWADHWPRRGRDSLSLCMTRLDVHEPWSRHNVCLLTRQQLGQRKSGSHWSQGIEMKTYAAPAGDHVLDLPRVVPQRLGGRQVKYRRPT